MAGIRFTTWLDLEEREALKKAARENGCSENYIVRIILRSTLLGKPLPLSLQKEKVPVQ